jgi:hypothetical protein
MKIKLGFKNRLIIIVLSGVVLTAVVVASLFNMSSDLAVADAEKRVRVYLTKEMSQKLIQVNAVYPEGYEKQQKLSELAEELKKVNAVEIKTIEVRKLIPDILIRPSRPTHIARVEMRTATEKFPPRYFWLPWSNIDSETTEAAWYFSL